MAKSIESRLNGNSPEFLKDVEYGGTMYAMDKWEIKDYVACRKFIEAKTGDPNFGISPRMPVSPGRNLGDQLLEAFEGYVLRKEARVKELDERIRNLEYQLRLEGMKNTSRAIEIMELLSEKGTA